MSWRDSRNAAGGLQDAAEREPKETADAAIAKLIRFQETLSSCEPTVVRPTLHELLAGVTLWWRRTGTRSHELAKGLIEFNGAGLLRVAGPGVAPGGCGL